MQVKREMCKGLPEIIRESVRPMERIDGIKIVQVEGLRSDGSAQSANGGSGQPAGQNGNLADQIVSSALRYRAQQPLVDSLLGEIGLGAAGLNDLTRSLGGDIETGGDKGEKA
mgnify:CR=1 FL=1